MRISASDAGFVPGHRTPGASPQPTCMILEDQSLIALSLEAYLEEIGSGRARASRLQPRPWNGSVPTHPP